MKNMDLSEWSAVIYKFCVIWKTPFCFTSENVTQNQALLCVKVLSCTIFYVI